MKKIENKIMCLSDTKIERNKLEIKLFKQKTSLKLLKYTYVLIHVRLSYFSSYCDF